MRINTMVLALVAGYFIGIPLGHAQITSYQSPYQIVLTVPSANLYEPDNAPPRNDTTLESSTAFQDWYSRSVLERYGAWGPEPRHYPAVPDFESLPVNWKRQRLLAVASGMIGLPYQHHHIPDWNPPPDWPWKPVANGRNSRGMDCSDFTSWLYNYGLGIKLITNVAKQADFTQIPGPGDKGVIVAEVIRDDGGYSDLIRKLKAGDLLYIKNKEGIIGHVIMWVGEYGRSPDGVPLIIDCTGQGHRDCNGNDIPTGVQLRPFSRDGWYYKSFDHAHRVLTGV